MRRRTIALRLCRHAGRGHKAEEGCEDGPCENGRSRVALRVAPEAQERRSWWRCCARRGRGEGDASARERALLCVHDVRRKWRVCRKRGAAASARSHPAERGRHSTAWRSLSVCELVSLLPRLQLDLSDKPLTSRPAPAAPAVSPFAEASTQQGGSGLHMRLLHHETLRC